MHGGIVSYDHAKHFEQVTHICKDVYGGHDYLPNQVLKYSRDSNKAVLVLEGGLASGGLLVGIVCIERRQDTIFVLGLRVHPQHHGRGIGARLTAAAESHSRTLPGVLTMQTATISPNRAMQSILGKQGWQVQQAMDMWPASEETVRAAQQAGGESVVSHVDGAAAALSTPAALELLPRWQVCGSVPELEAAVSQLQAELEPSQSLPAAGSARCWLPFHYAPLPVESPEVAKAVQAGSVWLLPGGAAANGAAAQSDGVRGQPPVQNSHAGQSNGVSGSQPVSNGWHASDSNCSNGSDGTGGGGGAAVSEFSGGCRGALIVQRNWDASASEYTHHIAGIVVASAAAAESALLLAERLQPYFVAFMARKSEHEPAVFAATPTHPRYVLVYKKDL